MPKPREYKKGEQVGEYGITFIKDFSVKKWIIEKEGILPVATVYFKEGHWQI